MREKNSSKPKAHHLVEFYDHEHLENLVSLLREEYSGITYVHFCHSNEPDRAEREILNRFVRRRFGFAPRFLEIPEHSVECALEHFRTLVSPDAVYDFDVTGGSSVFIAAAGALLAETSGQGMTIHEYDVAKGSCILRCPADSAVRTRSVPAGLTVPEALELRGICTLGKEDNICRAPGGNELKKYVHRIWEAVRSDLRAWNTFCTTASEVIYTNSWIEVEKQVSSHESGNCKVILNALKKNGFLTNWTERETDGTVSFSYRLRLPPPAWIIFEKAGNLLELLTCFAALENRAVTDCRMGVKLDWESGSKDPYANPFNEIDVIATMGHIPWFISCKNTGVEKDYFYEILTMSRHFGGIYAVPALVTTKKCNQALWARAKEMGIVLIDDISGMTAREFSQKLCRAMNTARRCFW